jgi:chromosomal replication initiator protein
MDCGSMTTRSAEQIWETALGELEIDVNRSNFRTWLDGTVGLSFRDSEFAVGVPNTFVAEFLERNLRSLVEKVLTGLTRSEVKVHFQVAAGGAGVPSRSKPLSLFNPKYTFDTFIVGSSNQLAFAAAQKVVESPGKAYNPLFIHGPAGMGKTHLLHAIGHAATAEGLDALFVSAEQFTNELVSAIRGGEIEDFRRKYRSVDVLMVDDVQFFGGKERTRENFFHTFNALHADNRQVAVTCDCPPRSIPQIQEQMRSRFEWGLVTDLQPPDFETRLSILQAKAKREGVEIMPDVLEIIALQIKENIRRLEGSLNRIIAYARLMQTLITPELVTRALDDIAVKEPPPERLTPPQIAETVASSFQIPLSELKGRKRNETTALARQVSMYLMRQETECSLAEIGRELGGRSPATISYAYEKIASNISNDPHLRRQVFNIQQKLHSPPRTTD